MKVDYKVKIFDWYYHATIYLAGIETSSDLHYRHLYRYFLSLGTYLVFLGSVWNFLALVGQELSYLLKSTFVLIIPESSNLLMTSLQLTVWRRVRQNCFRRFWASGLLWKCSCPMQQWVLTSHRCVTHPKSSIGAWPSSEQNCDFLADSSNFEPLDPPSCKPGKSLSH